MRRNCAKSPTNLPVYRIAFLTLWKKGAYQCYSMLSGILNCSNLWLWNRFSIHFFLKTAIEQFLESSIPGPELKPFWDLCYLFWIFINAVRFSAKAYFPDRTVPSIGLPVFQRLVPESSRFPESAFWSRNRCPYLSFSHFFRSGFCRSRNQMTIMCM